MARKNIAGVRFYVETNGPTPREISRAIQKALKEYGFASIVAMTRTAKRIKEAQPKTMRQVFDRPTPFTLNSVFMEPATKQRPYARVWLKDDSSGSRTAASGGSGTPAAKYLMPNIAGIPRGPKPSEMAMRRQGILGANEFIVPAKVPLNRYGNVTAGTMNQILANIGGFDDPHLATPGSKPAQYLDFRNKVRRQARVRPYFVATIKGNRAIWLRLKNGVKPMFWIVKGPINYRKRYSFIKVARAEFRLGYPEELRRAVAEGFAKSKK